jgi:hypothetical protein
MRTTTLIAAFVALFVSATIALASGDRPAQNGSKLGVRNPASRRTGTARRWAT